MPHGGNAFYQSQGGVLSVGGGRQPQAKAIAAVSNEPIVKVDPEYDDDALFPLSQVHKVNLNIQSRP